MHNAERDLRAHLIMNDAKMPKKHFEGDEKKNESFQFKMEIEETGILANFFWTDAKSRRAYACFGDVIVFATTLAPMSTG